MLISKTSCDQFSYGHQAYLYHRNSYDNNDRRRSVLELCLDYQQLQHPTRFSQIHVSDSGTYFDLQNIATHEIGHAINMGHVSDVSDGCLRHPCTRYHTPERH